jgi:small subunit ribosomal protein S17
MITKKGTVVRISGNKTVKVEVNEYRTHPKYKKRYRITKRFLVHDEKENAKVGAEVTIAPCTPISKRKSWEIFYSKTNTAQS